MRINHQTGSAPVGATRARNPADSIAGGIDHRDPTGRRL